VGQSLHLNELVITAFPVLLGCPNFRECPCPLVALLSPAILERFDVKSAARALRTQKSILLRQFLRLPGLDAIFGVLRPLVTSVCPGHKVSTCPLLGTC
jgi:hypothetical protein